MNTRNALPVLLLAAACGAGETEAEVPPPSGCPAELTSLQLRRNFSQLNGNAALQFVDAPPPGSETVITLATRDPRKIFDFETHDEVTTVLDATELAGQEVSVQLETHANIPPRDALAARVTVETQGGQQGACIDTRYFSTEARVDAVTTDGRTEADAFPLE